MKTILMEDYELSLWVFNLCQHALYGEHLEEKEEARKEILKILRSDSIGYEGNLRPILELHDGEWVNVGYD